MFCKWTKSSLVSVQKQLGCSLPLSRAISPQKYELVFERGLSWNYVSKNQMSTRPSTVVTIYAMVMQRWTYAGEAWGVGDIRTAKGGTGGSKSGREANFWFGRDHGAICPAVVRRIAPLAL
jgi:hypothetical protein